MSYNFFAAYFRCVSFCLILVISGIVNPGIYLAGASGGVYALITAHIATIIMVCNASLKHKHTSNQTIHSVRFAFPIS